MGAFRNHYLHKSRQNFFSLYFFLYTTYIECNNQNNLQLSHRFAENFSNILSLNFREFSILLVRTIVIVYQTVLIAVLISRLTSFWPHLVDPFHLIRIVILYPTLAHCCTYHTFLVKHLVVTFHQNKLIYIVILYTTVSHCCTYLTCLETSPRDLREKMGLSQVYIILTTLGDPFHQNKLICIVILYKRITYNSKVTLVYFNLSAYLF